MEIQHQKEQRMSDSSDSWDPQELKITHTERQKYSLFQKITIKYDDRIIQKNLDSECQKPILNSDLFPFQDQQKIQQTNLQQTQQQKNLGDEQKSTKHQKKFMQTEQNCEDKKNKQAQDSEALFNAIEDEQNESWMRKKVKESSLIFQNKKQLRPLTCPQCFTQVCYIYESIRQCSKNQKSQLQTQNNHFVKNQQSYKAKIVDNIIIHEHKIIRNRFASENMQKKPNYEVNRINSILNKELEFYEKDLKSRYEDINVKILVSCEECELELGYWDVNQQMYVLFNVI